MSSNNPISLPADLLAFAKEGAPPTREPLMFIVIESIPKHFEHLFLAEGNVSDMHVADERKDCKEFCGDHCTCDMRLKWVDTNPTYAKALAARPGPDLTTFRGWCEANARLDDGESPAASASGAPNCALGEPYMPRMENMVTPPFALRFNRLGCSLPGCGTAWAACTDCADEKPKKRERPPSLAAFAAGCHRDNQHWWHDPATGKKLDRNMGEMLMLVVSEIAECLEGERKDLMDTHLPHRKMAEVELADAVIRIADIVGSNTERCLAFDSHHRGVSTELDVRTLSDNKGEALLAICSPLQSIRRYEGYTFGRKLARCFARIETYAKMHGYDLWGAVAEKREYNKHRPDHQPAARLAANGKKF